MLQLKVARRVQEAPEIVSLELVSATGDSLPPFEAGSHIDVHLPGALVRQYSLCNAPEMRDHYRIAVRRDVAGRGGSVAVHSGLTEGSAVEASAPKNHFALDASAQDTLLFAGGIGITPLLAMAHALHARGSKFTLHYSAHTRESAAFVDELLKQPWAASVKLHFSEGEHADRLDMAAVLAKPSAQTHLYVCGPKRFADALIATARDAGWTGGQIHFEYFSGADAHTADDGSFDVQIKSTGKVIRVEAAQTIVEALLENGVEVPTSCEQGVCGTCLTRVLQGTPDHRDFYLTDAERAKNDQMLPCCSRSLDPCLVLDL